MTAACQASPALVKRCHVQARHSYTQTLLAGGGWPFRPSLGRCSQPLSWRALPLSSRPRFCRGRD